jgi:hypothetical protein
MLNLPTPLTKLLGPVLKLLQALFAHTGADIRQTGVEVFDANGPDVFWRHVKQLFTERERSGPMAASLARAVMSEPEKPAL